ncbi:hypothetical protein LCGC14_1685180 [marine sediment metagenome]|uniref:Uncharacterized protein n=1 Tax=marine sediment metagenome TaxID=412755 RepID=A0A0F9K2X2_9ZZZZ
MRRLKFGRKTLRAIWDANVDAGLYAMNLESSRSLDGTVLIIGLSGSLSSHKIAVLPTMQQVTTAERMGANAVCLALALAHQHEDD